MTIAVILAGGMGTRLKSVVPNLPKPMAPIKGRPFLEYQLNYWVEQRVSGFVVSVGHMKEIIMSHFGTNYRSTPISYAIEEEPLGTGGGMLLAAKRLNEPFLLLNGDTFFEVDLVELLKQHTERKADLTFSLYRTKENSRYMGVEISEIGKIITLNSEREKQGQLVNGGVYMVNPDILKNTQYEEGKKLSLEDDIVPDLMVKGANIFGVEYSGKFIDIGIPADYYRAATILAKRME